MRNLFLKQNNLVLVFGVSCRDGVIGLSKVKAKGIAVGVCKLRLQLAISPSAERSGSLASVWQKGEATGRVCFRGYSGTENNQY